jgi:hypothetical protein
VRLGEHLVDGAHLDRVAERCPGAVRLDVLEVARRHPGARQRRAHDGDLRGPVRHGEPGALAVLADRGAQYQREDGVAVAQRVGLSLEDDHPAALGAAVAVGALVEGLAPTVGGERVHVGQQRRAVGVVDRVDPAAQGEIALAAAQSGHREVQGHQRRGARRVHGDRRPAQAEEVRHPPGHRRVHQPGGDVAVQVVVGQPGELQRVVDGTRAEVRAPVAVPEPGGVDVRVLQRLPGRLQDQALLRVDAVRLPGGDVEELRVELVDAGEEAATGGVHLAPAVAGVRGEVPPVGRDGGGPGAAPGEELREVGRGVVVTGETQPDADHGDGLEFLQHESLDESLLLAHRVVRGGQFVVRRHVPTVLRRAGPGTPAGAPPSGC